MSSQHKDTYWTLWQVLNWIICRKPQNQPPWQFTAFEQDGSGVPDRELLPPLEIDAAQPGKAELGIRNLETGEVTEYILREPLPIDNVVDAAERALVNTLQKGSMKVRGRSPGNDLHDEVDARNWVTPQFTDKQGVKIRSTEFEDIRFLADEIQREWPETSQGLLHHFLSGGDKDQPDESSPSAHSSKHDKKPSSRKHDAIDDALLKNRISNVLALARDRWPDPKRRPGYMPMAKELVRAQGKSLEFKSETVRKILAGTYPTSQRLGISKL